MKFFKNGLFVIMLSMALLVQGIALAVDMEFVKVDDAGNTKDPLTDYGAVGYEYYIGKYEVTNAQYAEMLNDVAVTNDPYNLYNPDMAGDQGGIVRSGSSGSYTYNVKSGWENKPVVWISWYDAARFANWMMTGNTEGTSSSGAYDTSNFGAPYDDDPPEHNAGATYWVATENEWYKAAYYDSTLNGGEGGYYLYPTRSNTTDPSMANYGDWPGSVVDVGSYNYPSYYGTYDQAGNALEWTNDLFNGDNAGYRALRGGIFSTGEETLRSTYRFENDPDYECRCRGFRLVATPEAISSILGDINKDGVVDISDVILVLRIALQLDPLKPCSDINNDGVVDISDVILTLRMALGLDPLEQCTE